MTDIGFDILTREIEFENGDFKLINDPSVQNGGIIKDATVANIYFPTIGVGINENLLNSPIERLISLMNTWQTQCKQDGAKKAIYQLTQNNNSVDIAIVVNYV